MVDLPEGIKGPAMPQEPQRKTQRTPETEKFQKEMHKKVEKISETDAEQKKKRKRKEEAEEEEDPNEVSSGPSVPKDLIPPFHLEQQSKKVSPLDMQKRGAISPLESAQPTSLGSENTPAPFYAPPPPAASDEIQDDAVLDTSYIEMPEEELPSTSYTPPSLMSTQMPAPSVPSSSPPQESQTSDENPPDKATPPPKKEGKPKKAAEKKAAQGLEIEPMPAPNTKKKGVTADELEKMVEGAPIESAGYFAAMKKESTPALSKKEEAAIEGITPLPPLPPSDYIEKEKKKTTEAENIAPVMQEPSLLPQTPPSLTPPETPTPYALLHPQIMELFERMVGTMSVMHLSGVNETVINLNAQKFASSVFFGTQIIIKEYSSAPLAYNIEINGSPQALALLERNSAALMAAFQHGNYAFRVHRLESGLLEEKPKVRRKEPTGKGKEK